MSEPDNFEDALTRLKELVEKLEEGDLSLNESITLYEEGIMLSTYCNETLEKAEQRIEKVEGNDENHNDAN